MVSELTGHTRPELPSWSKGISTPKGKTNALPQKEISAHSSSLGKPVIADPSSPVLRLFALLERNLLFPQFNV